VEGARVVAYFLYALSAVLIAVAIVGYLKEPKLIVPHAFAAASGIVLFVSGVAYHRVASSRAQGPNQSMETTASRRYI
jgi:hypothetical protein